MSKSHPKIFNILFLFFKTKSYKRGGGSELSVVGNESDSHKMCFSEPRGLFYILWHEDTKRKLFFRSLVGAAHSAGLELSVTSLPEPETLAPEQMSSVAPWLVVSSLCLFPLPPQTHL